MDGCFFIVYERCLKRKRICSNEESERRGLCMNLYVGIIILLVVFGIGIWLFKKSKGFFLFMLLFVVMILGVVVLKVIGISYE